MLILEIVGNKSSAEVAATWKPSKGPEGIQGYGLYVPNTEGDGKGLSNIGWTDKKPKTSGNVTLYNGTKDVTVNLDKYTFK